MAQAALAFLQHRNLLVHCHCDKIHRLIRDLKLSIGCDPKFNEMMLATTYAWSVNYKPHGSGAFGDEKYDVLANFFDSCVMEDSLKANLIMLVLCFKHHSKITELKLKLVAGDVVQELSEQDSEHFQRYKCLIALDFEDDFGRTPTDSELWEHMSELPSFLAKRGLPKPGRWFAWHECAVQQLSEFFSTRCLLDWYFEDEGLPATEEAGRFQKSRGDLGGLKLLHRALSFVNHECAHVVLLVSRPCWTWYTEQVSEIKTPQQGLEQLMSWALSWYKDDHLLAIVKTMYDWRSLKKLVNYQVHENRGDDEDELATLVFKYASNILSRRLWTMSRYGTSPECFVGLLMSCVDHRHEAMDMMRKDWRLLNLAEQSHKCVKILPDLQFLFSAPVRLACALFEQSGWNETSVPGIFVLKAILKVLPDNKIVEDCHQAVRVEAKSHPNQKMTVPRVQSCVMNSNVFSSRELFHVGKLTKEEFIQKWGKRQTADEQYGRKTFASRYHRLPKSFSNIMKKKSWTSVNEEQYGKSYAAWHWIRFYTDNTLAQASVKVDDTWNVIQPLVFAEIVS